MMSSLFPNIEPMPSPLRYRPTGLKYYKSGFKKCSQCKEKKEIDQFHKDSTKPNGHQSICKTCKEKRYPNRNLTRLERRIIRTGENIFLKCSRCGDIKVLEEFKSSSSRKLLKHFGICNQCRLKTGKRAGYFHISSSERNKIYDQKIKKIVMMHYSKGTLSCKSCGIDNLDFLTIDHIYGNGSKHRINSIKNRRPGGRTFYNWLIKNNFPEGYQVLCWKCNVLKGPFGPYRINKKKEADENKN